MIPPEEYNTLDSLIVHRAPSNTMTWEILLHPCNMLSWHFLSVSYAKSTVHWRKGNCTFSGSALVRWDPSKAFHLLAHLYSFVIMVANWTHGDRWSKGWMKGSSAWKLEGNAGSTFQDQWVHTCQHYSSVLDELMVWFHFEFDGLVCIWFNQLAFPKGLPSAPGRPRVAPNSPVIFDVSLEYIPGLDDEE